MNSKINNTSMIGQGAFRRVINSIKPVVESTKLGRFMKEGNARVQFIKIEDSTHAYKIK